MHSSQLSEQKGGLIFIFMVLLKLDYLYLTAPDTTKVIRILRKETSITIIDSPLQDTNELLSSNHPTHPSFLLHTL